MVRSAQPRYGADGACAGPEPRGDTTADDRSARSPIAIPSGCEVPQAAESVHAESLQTELRVVSKTAGAQVIGQVGPLIPHEPVRVQVGLGRFVTLAWDDIRRVELPLPPTPTALRLSALPMPAPRAMSGPGRIATIVIPSILGGIAVKVAVGAGFYFLVKEGGDMGRSLGHVSS